MNSNSIRIVEYAHAYKEPVMRLMNCQPFKYVIWDWQFQNFTNGETAKPLVALDAAENVVGYNGVMPIKVKYRNELIDAIWSCDFYLDEQCRGKGFGKAIKDVLKDKSKLVMAFGISSMASPVLLKMGWKENGEVFSYKRLNEIRNTKSLAVAIFQMWQRFKHVMSAEYGTYLITSIENVLPDEGEVNRLWNEVSSGYAKIVVRDFQYMNWKYAKHPICSYRYIYVYDDDKLVAIAVIRRADRYAQLVDYLGPAKSIKIKQAIVSTFCRYFKKVQSLRCLTSDVEMHQALESHYFYPEKAKPRFYIYSNLKEDDALGDWFLMGGDSDADLLSASIDSREAVYPEDIVISRLSQDEFYSMKDEWSELLSRSNANKLFMGWLWQTNWWKVWGGGDAQLFILAARDSIGRLVGIAPLYKVPTLLGRARLQIIGQRVGSGDNIRSEYLDFILSMDCELTALKSFIDHLASDAEWGEIVARDMPSMSRTPDLFYGYSLHLCYFRELSKEEGVAINVNGDYEAYLDKLGRNTRYKMRNRRRILENSRGIEFVLAKEGELDLYFSKLNEIHHFRWSEPCFSGKALAFHRTMAKELYREGGVRMSQILVDGVSQSVLYNLYMDGREYNIQSSFNPDFDMRVSLGTLHFAYSLQNAFSDSTCLVYDLLAGKGKETFYKSRYKGDVTTFVSFQVVRSPILILLYWIYDQSPYWIRRYLRSAFSRSQ